jgi:glycogenin
LRRSPVSEGFGSTEPFSAPEMIHPRPVHPPSISQDLRSPHHAHVEPVAEVRSVVPLYVHGEEQSSVYISVPSKGHEKYSELKASFSTPRVPATYHTEHIEVAAPAQPEKVPSPPPPPQPEERPFSPPRSEWDASRYSSFFSYLPIKLMKMLTSLREPPPLHSRPEAISLETQTYTMSEDTHLFQPPPSYPEAPKNMYYEVPATKPEPERLAQIFPWETHASKPTRVFAEDLVEITAIHPGVDGADDEHADQLQPQFIQVATIEEVTTPSLPSDSWQSYSRGNAWDEVPEINRYIEAIQQRSKPNSKAGGSGRPASLKITDFPTEIDRPSLPVTPAPIRRSFLDSHQEEHEHEHHDKAFGCCKFPIAEGVPNQCDWVGVTVDAFLQLLVAVYSYWKFTESTRSTGRIAAAAVGALRDTTTATATTTTIITGSSSSSSRVVRTVRRY